MKTLIILGSGGYGHTVADVAEQLGYNILFLDDSLVSNLSIFEHFCHPIFAHFISNQLEK